MAMKAIAGTLSNTEEMAHSIITLLNGENWSILYQRVKDTDGKRPKIYRNLTLRTARLLN